MLNQSLLGKTKVCEGIMKLKKEALKDIIKDELINIVFQPVISLTNGDVLGYEALSRFTTKTIFKSIEDLFETAIEYDLIWDLERLSRSKTLEAAKEFMVPPYNQKLFLNVHPSVIYNDKFNQELLDFFMDEYDISPHNIAFDVTEKFVIEGQDGFKSSISHYKSQRYLFSLENSGIEYSGLNAISELEPNFIKLDMKMIRDIHQDSLKSAVVKGMVEFSKTNNVALIASGVESSEEFRTVIDLGVHYAQGYYIQKPFVDIRPVRPEVRGEIQLMNKIRLEKSRNEVNFTPIKQLISKGQTIPPTMPTIEAYELMNTEAHHMGLVVVDNHNPMGIVSKESLAFTLSGRYGFTLYQNKPITKIMNHNFLAVDANTPVNIVADMAMARPADALYDFIVVTENNKYIGVVTIKTMLQKAIEVKISTAKEQNPLTGLPGNVLIAQQLQRALENGRPFSVGYVDIDYFKAYNDAYGFENGNTVIKMLADILKKYIPKTDFVGHIGGDDFVIVFDGHISENYFQKISHVFEKRVLNCYNLVDRERGYITSEDRSGEMKNFPLLSITTVQINDQTQAFTNTFELSETLAKLKTQAKNHKRNYQK